VPADASRAAVLRAATVTAVKSITAWQYDIRNIVSPSTCLKSSKHWVLLAHEHRLAIFRLLIERGPEGLAVGRIADRVGLVPSSLTFHLQNLQRAGLIAQRRESRQLFLAAE
jgi:predicted transcriptional regulator